MTRNKQLPVYFLYETCEIDETKVIFNINNLIEINKQMNNLIVFYNHKYSSAFTRIRSKLLNDKIKTSSIPFNPDMYNDYNQNEDFLIYSRIFKDLKQFDKNDIIIYFGGEDDKLITALSIQYVNQNKIILIKENFEINELTSVSVNKIYYRRFNLIQKAKESEVFGIIVGSLSISGLNEILEKVKLSIRSKNKKYYTFLLGKITLEKLSNFIEYIDCFVLIACPFSDFYEFRTLMKPMVSSLDIELALNENNFKWDMSYTFDPNYIISKSNQHTQNVKDDNGETNEIMSNFTGLKLNDKEKNAALANIFSIKTLENYDKRLYKGLNVNEIKGEVQKFKLGKSGIPLKYEDLKE